MASTLSFIAGFALTWLYFGIGSSIYEFSISRQRLFKDSSTQNFSWGPTQFNMTSQQCTSRTSQVSLKFIVVSSIVASLTHCGYHNHVDI